MKLSIVVAGWLVLLLHGHAWGQSARQVPAAAEAEQNPVLTAPLMAIVGDGLIELRQGRSVDLTKGQILLTLVPEQRYLDRNIVSLRIAGHDHQMGLGNRLDLKNWSPTSKVVKDRDNCFLDLIEVVAPKGAPAAASFRFSCL